MLSHYINEKNHTFGNPDSKIILEVYEDYECEPSGKAFRDLKVIREFFKQDICIKYKNFPHVQMHPSALRAAQIVESCGLQGKYLEAHDLILENQELLEYGMGGIVRLLEKIYSVSVLQLYESLKNIRINRKINNDIKRGTQLGIKHTPAIFINNLMYEGAIKFDSIAPILREIISENNIGATNNKNENKRA